MQLKEINRIIGYKKKLEKHKKSIESEVKEAVIQEKTADKNIDTKKNIIKKKTVAKKTKKDVQKVIPEKADDTHKENISHKKDLIDEESKVISDKDRAERFKRLHDMVLSMAQKRKE